jgi:curved DNA-binding protein CbpA
MELKIGKMTNKELAEWFDIKPDTMTRHKKKKLEELKSYADFTEIRGGVEITCIRKLTYNKKDSQIRQIYEQGFEEVRQPIDTVSNINNQIYEKYYEQLPTLSSAQSGYHYAIEVRNEKYGIPFKEHGTKGCCYYCWCKQEIDENNISPYLRNAREIKEWMVEKKTTKPPSASAKNEKEKSLGTALYRIRSESIKKE